MTSSHVHYTVASHAYHIANQPQGLLITTIDSKRGKKKKKKHQLYFKKEKQASHNNGHKISMQPIK
jgi:hypothetical protein